MPPADPPVAAPLAQHAGGRRVARAGPARPHDRRLSTPPRHDRHQRGRLRLGDEGVPPSAARRSRLRRASGAVRRQGERRHRAACTARADSRRHPIAGLGPVVYHDACHLAHAQQVREQPRKLLARYPAWSCAGRQTPTAAAAGPASQPRQPEPAAELGERQAHDLEATQAAAVAAPTPARASDRRLLRPARPPSDHLLDRRSRRPMTVRTDNVLTQKTTAFLSRRTAPGPSTASARHCLRRARAAERPLDFDPDAAAGRASD